MMVMVCICYQAEGGGSSMLTQLMDFAIEPLVSDWIELLPERGGPGQDRHISEWHERVDDRWIHRSQSYALEVHVRAYLTLTQIAELRDAGYD